MAKKRLAEKEISLDRLYKPDLKSDLKSGLVVFLIALPLCLGIALASGANLFSGLIAGIVGGIVVGLLTGSPLSVSGPAAGLTVIVINAIQTLGKFEYFLAAIVIAGLLQICLGFLKAGSIASYFPSNVIKGMLAAIGLILILKQIPHALGYDKDPEGDFNFIQPVDDENTLSELVNAINKLHPGAIIISIISFALIWLWGRAWFKKLSVIPVGLIVVIVGTIVSLLLERNSEVLGLSSDHLVSIPQGDLLSNLTFPDFSILKDPVLWRIAGTLAIVASLETLLSVEAIDKLDPSKRNSRSNRELMAQGVGNTVSGMIGGLPITAVIVRGSANIHAGAKSRYSSVIHGCFLLLAVFAIPGLINMIPLSSLAVLLIVVGYKLCNAGLIKGMVKAGPSQYIPFFVTILAILFTDLLIGIGIGMAVSVIFILRSLTSHTYFLNTKARGEEGKKVINITLSEQVSFLSKAQISSALDNIPENAEVVIDGTNSKYIDYDVAEMIHDFSESAPDRSISVEVIGVDKVHKTGGH